MSVSPTMHISYTLLPSDPSRNDEPNMSYAEEHKTSVELKTALINRALEETGMGRYQWCIFFLCGFGYALDLMWAQAFSLVTPRIQQELGVAGVIITSLISWALIPKFACTPNLPACTAVSDPSSITCCTKSSNYGWRYALFVIGALSVFAFIARFVLFSFHESPKFLVSKGRDAEAVEVVKAVAKFNRRSCVLTLQDMEDCERTSASDSDESLRGGGGEVAEKKAKKIRVGHLTTLFSTWSMTRLTILTWICYAADYWGFVIAGNFLPKFLADRGAAANESTYDTYRN
ncbi:hypothetical protein PHLCEN_2v10240 [Hermanssonia centrifuga]|uniref:Uncharacterized protein n=1 Tax=Hermanssonia centrifuga TaxID=98765 RepID=A0A2R6NNE8_9APHY|nr:hypothetical protein PHLCEN_2v10240 [Hermanssonia centrifuga]